MNEVTSPHKFPSNKELVKISRQIRDLRHPTETNANGRKADDTRKGFPNEKRRKCIAFDNASEKKGKVVQCRNERLGNNNPTICCALGSHCKNVVRNYCSDETVKELIAKVVARAPEGAEEQERFLDELEKLFGKAWKEIKEKKEREEREKDKENSPPEQQSLAPAATNARQPLQTLPLSPNQVQALFNDCMRKTYRLRNLFL